MVRSIAVEPGGPELEGTERERIIRKIKRCLALGESSNVNEAEMAIRQAQAMMRTYRLNEIDIQVQSVGCEKHKTGLMRMTDWQRGLANTAALAFNCKMLISRYKGGPITFMFIGVMPAAELAAYAYDSLLAQIKPARKQFQKERGASRRAADDFCLAWVHAVKTKMVKFAQDNAEQSNQSNALILVETREEAAISAWIAKEHGEVKTRSQAQRDDYDRMAILHGIKAGEQAVINQAVSGGRGGPLLLA